MKVYDDKYIKNVAFVGAHSSGKTTLAETMLLKQGYLTGGELLNKKIQLLITMKLSKKDKLLFLQPRCTQNGAITKLIF